MTASAAALVAAVFLLGKHLWWFSDDWNIFAEYSTGSVLEPFNDHLSAVPILGYRAMFTVVGMESYLGVQILGLAAYLALAVATYRYVARRFGSWTAVGFASLLIWNSAASTNAMFPFLLNFSLPIALLVVVWSQLDRHDRGGDMIAAAALTVALATSAIGVIAAGAVAVELLVDRAPLRRWLVLLPGPALWAVWYLSHPAETGGGGSVGEIVRYAGRMFLGGSRSLSFDVGWLGWIAALAFVGGVTGVVVIHRRISGRSAGAVAALLAFIAVTSYARVGIDPYIPPDELRYRWTVAAFMVLVATTLADDVRRRVAAEEAGGDAGDPHAVGDVSSAAGRRLAVAIALTALVVGNGLVLLDGMDDWDEQVGVALPGVRSNIAAAELAGDRADPERRLQISYVPLTVGGYLDAVDRLGSPLAPLDQEIGGGVLERRAADELLIESLDIDATASSTAPDCDAPADVALADDPVTAPPGSVVLVEGPPDSRGDLLLSRFGAAADGIFLDDIGAQRTATVTLPPDADTATAGLGDAVGDYRISVPAGTRVRVCTGP